MKKRIILPISAAIILIAAILLLADLNHYTYKTKSIATEDSGIIFSITTFDGKTESEPFIKSLGHTWLSIENKTDNPIMLNDYEISCNETVTFSIWAISGHSGVYYNLEPNFVKGFERYDGRKSLNIKIEPSQIKTIENYINNNDNWTLTKNCSRFSLELWNQIVSQEYKLKTQALVYTPKRLQKSFEEFDCVEVNKSFANAKDVFIYRDGVRTELQLCS